jgi:hypothetical protein
MLRYMRPAGGGLAAVSLGTAGAYFVAVITAGHPLPWWPYVLLLGLAVLGAIGYIAGPADSEPRKTDRTERNRDPTAVQVPLPQPRRPSGTSHSPWDRNQRPQGHIKSFRLRRKVSTPEWIRGKVSGATRDAGPRLLVHSIMTGRFDDDNALHGLQLDSKGNFRAQVFFGANSMFNIGEEFVLLLVFAPRSTDLSNVIDELPEDVQILDQRRMLRI